MKNRIFILFLVFYWNNILYSQVVFNELMIDPTPIVSLPDCEFIELYNTSDDSVSIGNWIIKGGTCDCILPPFSLASHSYVLIASTSSKGKLDSYGNVLYRPCFPTLNNDGKTLVLVDAHGVMRDVVSYRLSWYGSDSKSKGGWTLERKDAMLACSCADNWIASTNQSGGTPDQKNSVAGNVSIAQSTIRSVGNITDSSVTISFSSQMDSATLFNRSNYTFDHGFGNPIALFSNFPNYDVLTLVVSSVLLPGQIYRVALSSEIENCSKLAIDAVTKRFAFADTVVADDLVINEILFNPPVDGEDFVELFNRSNKVLDLNTISLANKNISTNEIGTLSMLSSQGLLVYPNDYVVVTANEKLLQSKYSIPKEAIVVELSSFPSFPDAEGIASIANRQGTTIDEFHYKSSMQSEQLSNVEGVSLERIQPDVSTNQLSNWHSAAWSSGFATPGYQNSQYMDSQSGGELLTVSPRVISPNNDGVDDVAACIFNLPDDGFSASIVLFNQNGVMVRKLVSNKTLATSGTFYWDGTDDNGMLLPIGIYIILCSAHDLKGNKKDYKTICTIVSK